MMGIWVGVVAEGGTEVVYSCSQSCAVIKDRQDIIPL